MNPILSSQPRKTEPASSGSLDAAGPGASLGPQQTWRHSLSDAIRDPDELITALGLPDDLRVPARAASQLFPLVVPRSYLARMRLGDSADPLLRQVLPAIDESRNVPGFGTDAVGDAASREVPGLLHKYHGRALLIASGNCAVNCRYCFRRHYPYADEPRRMSDWEPALAAIAADPTLHEILLSGGDPLVLSDGRLRQLFGRLAEISHVRRLRIHSRLPIVLPDRVTEEFLDLLLQTRLSPVMVVHANHPNEIVGDCAEALRRLVRRGVPTLNQSVLLRGVNDSADILAELSERLIDLGVIPYYLHQLDRVAGASHFEVPVEEGRQLVEGLRSLLPGYAVPRYVQEVAGDDSKRPI